MKRIFIALVFVILASTIAMADNPIPPEHLTLNYACNSVVISWSISNPTGPTPIGFNVYRNVDIDGSWRLRTSQMISDTAFIDNDIILGHSFTYGVSAVYDNGESEILSGSENFLPDPASVDYFILGTDSSEFYNRWYADILDSLGLRGEYISNILPYCGSSLAQLRLLWVVSLSDEWTGNSTKAIALVDYLNHGGRIYIHEGGNAYSDTLRHYLPFDYMTCIGYPFTSMHGVSGTFTEGLTYQFPTTLWSSNLGLTNPTYGEVVLEDDVQCGCVDLAIAHSNYKAVINSQPLDQALDNDASGTRLEYFRRMLVYFDILTGINEANTSIKPERFALSAYPNPFNSQVKLSLDSPSAKGGQLDIYDVTGRLIRHLPISPNSSEILWNGQADNSQTVATGVYFARVISGENQQSIKLTLLK